MQKDYNRGLLAMVAKTIKSNDGCPSSTDQAVVAFESGLKHFLPFATSIKNFHCAVSLRVVTSKVNVDRPFVDVLVVGDHIWLGFFKQSICVTVQIANPLGVAVTASCTLSPFDPLRHHCLIRTEIPISWFLIDSDVPQVRQVVLLTHAVGASCIAPIFNRPKQVVQLEARTAKLQTIGLDKRDHWQLSLQTRSNLTFTPNSLNSVLVHLKKFNVSLSSDAAETPSIVHLKAWFDPRFEIVSASPVDPLRWSLQIESAAGPDFHTRFTCNFTGSGTKKNDRWDGYLFVILLKTKPESNAISATLTEETVIHWAVNYVYNDSKKYPNPTEERRVSVRFATADDYVYGIVAVPRQGELINTAVLTGTQAATTMRVFTVTLGGIFRDVTVQSHCISAEARVLKTSPTCSSVYVDGSELRGLPNIQVHVHHEAWTTNVAFTVWYPRLPIQVWISDPVLNAVDNWPVAVWKWLPNRRRHKREARQFACKNTYQQAEIRVLAAFQYGDERTGERVYLSGDRETLLDVTSLAANRIQSSNSDVVAVRKVDSSLLAVAKKPGSAKILVKAQAPLIDYGSASILVTDESVSVRQISVRTVVDLEMELYRSQKTKAFHYDIITRPQTIFTHRYQHGSIVVNIRYSDDQMVDLESIDPSHYTLSVFTSDEKGLVVSHKSVPEMELIALDDTNDVTVHVQLRSPAHCEDLDQPPLAVARSTARLFFNDRPRSPPPSTDDQKTQDESGGWRHQHVLLLLFLFASGAVVLYVLFGRGRHRLHDGYEKLVVPILARLGSSSSGTFSSKEEDSKEWVWLSKAHIDNSSLGSRYSQKSTIGVDHHSSGHGSTSVDDNTQRSISYRGSEISVFIAPQPSVSINDDCNELRHTTSWKRSRGVRMTKNPMVDSSSEHNLKRLTTGDDYGPFELQYPPRRPSRDGSWREPTSPITLRGLRESIA
uniref:TMEM132 domain-containing protein n=1 Tax=Steinernema glaseri TaxID=37863 RepID=A0A1I7YLJ1_9BILA